MPKYSRTFLNGICATFFCPKARHNARRLEGGVLLEGPKLQRARKFGVFVSMLQTCLYASDQAGRAVDLCLRQAGKKMENLSTEVISM